MQNLRRLLEKNPMEVVWPVVIFAVTFAVGWLVREAVLRALHAWAARSKSRHGKNIEAALRGPMLIWCVILGVHIALQSSGLPARYTGWAAHTLLALWILSLTLMFMRVAGDLVHDYGDRVPGALPVTTLTESLAKVTVLLLGLVLLLKDAFNISVTPLLTALGVGGLAVALALQDTLSNLFAGVYVAMAGQIRLGDYIKLNTGEEGYVTDIGWRATTIRSLANNMILVPNSKLGQAIVTNYHLPALQMSASLQVGVSYASDPEHIERVLLETARQAAGEIAGMLADPAPTVAFDPGFGESALLFTVNFQVAEFADQFGVRNELRKRLARRFREEGIEIPFPTRTVRWERPGAPP
ncbi:MAG: mechanosensitive ion channel family protein [Bryobacteraceae bacterium]|jgi:small-conductance mechanosensitive channel